MPRFSLQALLITVTLIALLCGACRGLWWLSYVTSTEYGREFWLAQIFIKLYWVSVLGWLSWQAVDLGNVSVQFFRIWNRKE